MAAWATHDMQVTQDFSKKVHHSCGISNEHILPFRRCWVMRIRVGIWDLGDVSRHGPGYVNWEYCQKHAPWDARHAWELQELWESKCQSLLDHVHERRCLLLINAGIHFLFPGSGNQRPLVGIEGLGMTGPSFGRDAQGANARWKNQCWSNVTCTLVGKHLSFHLVDLLECEHALTDDTQRLMLEEVEHGKGDRVVEPHTVQGIGDEMVQLRGWSS
ncbi:hypothetical protein BC826DRAFT_973154 [Russula brevipes]|nr:hypothetical protein BC826DRAFT_973154 [Russula brevipes]